MVRQGERARIVGWGDSQDPARLGCVGWAAKKAGSALCAGARARAARYLQARTDFCARCSTLALLAACAPRARAVPWGVERHAVRIISRKTRGLGKESARAQSRAKGQRKTETQQCAGRQTPSALRGGGAHMMEQMNHELRWSSVKENVPPPKTHTVKNWAGQSPPRH